MKNGENSNQNVETQPQVVFCCFPGRIWIPICGFTTLFIGTFWLMDELNIIRGYHWDIILPVILILWGIGYLIAYWTKYHKA